ncbi:hypothetical protein [Sphingobacterium corticibacterium]|uniref:Uncharacterized protein n=1 Tax=Sphingobacterium corticibacterium TaxID=2484746 RepID=A0A4Q6XH92_9SPHI|nr:hypothetical protein [Sphingobacterium corticibacterium]RZF58475.1 hypothetical protein EWE74_17880 [Sphingobacterium corticibacterium]
MYFIRFILRTVRVLAAGALMWLVVASLQEERLEKTLVESFCAEIDGIKVGILEGNLLKMDVEVRNVSTDSICVSLKILFDRSDARG